MDRTHPRILATKWLVRGEDGRLVALSGLLALGALCFSSVATIALGVWWGSNTIAHFHLHRPLFRGPRLNRFFSLYLTAIIGVPQSIWRRRHIAHHAGVDPRLRFEPALIGEVTVLAVVCGIVGWAVYLPGLLAGLFLCHLQGVFEHVGGTTSHYGFLYNLVFFNDGYHVEHHASPQAHWTELPLRRIEQAKASRWPAVFRVLDLFSLDALEHLALRSNWAKAFVLAKHERAFRRLLPEIGQVRRIAVVGGALFPRTALILERLLPHAQIVVIDASREHIEIARAQTNERVEYRHEWYDPKRHVDFDLVVIPLAFRGDRESLYRDCPARALIVHDWIWRTGFKGALVSTLLLKRLNLVQR